MSAPTLEEMQTARNRLIRLHHIPTDAAVDIVPVRTAVAAA